MVSHFIKKPFVAGGEDSSRALQAFILPLRAVPPGFAMHADVGVSFVVQHLFPTFGWKEL